MSEGAPAPPPRPSGLERPWLDQAVSELRAWVATGAHRINRSNPGAHGDYDQSDAVRIMDAWWPLLVRAEFQPLLGSSLLDQVENDFPINDQPGHGAAVHVHPHVHPSRRLLAAWRDGRLPTRALFVGAVHGIAGSAAVSLLVLATLRSAWSAVLYLGVFGLGTILGMTALTAAMALPVSLALRLRRARHVLAFGAGVGSIAFGIVYAIRVFWPTAA